MSTVDPEPLLSAKGLAIGYPGRKRAAVLAQGLELHLRPGEFTCLLGPNGAGKTTLLRSLSGALPPLSGNIQLQGHDLAGIAPRERARRIGVALSGTAPAGWMEARALVALGRHPYSGWLGRLDGKDRERIEWALEAVGATALAGRKIAELSDGERQKVIIARALAQETPVLLLDEPTAHLDLPNRIETMALLRRLAQECKMAILLSTHDLELALQQADRLWLLGPAGSFCQGEPEALARKGTLAEAFAHEALRWEALQGNFPQSGSAEQSGQVPE